MVGAFGPTLAVYSAYESDVSGSYQVLVGRQVRNCQSVSPPLQIVSVPQASYLVFRCSGPLPQAVIDGWHDVWAYFARRNAPPRAYTFDVETYPVAEPAEIWVAVQDS
jgi:predicted transcriptional regulator YdeE